MQNVLSVGVTTLTGHSRSLREEIRAPTFKDSGSAGLSETEVSILFKNCQSADPQWGLESTGLGYTQGS